MIDRRTVVAGLAGSAFPLPLAATEPMRWRPGTLQIHHIATGRGDATLIVTPSGHTVLVDVGDTRATGPAMVNPVPDGTLSAGRHVARYIKRRLAETGRQRLDALVITHFHDDHIGGVVDLLDEIDVGVVLDRAWPVYGYPPFEGPAGAVYAEAMRERDRRGKPVRRLQVGADDQILPGSGTCAIRTIAAGGIVWTGRGRSTRLLFPSRDELCPADRPNENACSAALLVTHGRFRYFLGGDLTDWADAGTRPWMNALTAAARAAGPVHVSTLPHHGMFDASSVATLKALQARDWVISAWHAVHPSLETLERVYNQRVYPGPRDIWATTIHPATDVALTRLTGRFSGRNGTIVAETDEDGKCWRISVRDPTSEATITYSEDRRIN